MRRYEVIKARPFEAGFSFSKQNAQASNKPNSVPTAPQSDTNLH